MIARPGLEDESTPRVHPPARSRRPKTRRGRLRGPARSSFN